VVNEARPVRVTESAMTDGAMTERAMTEAR
jgi:hypothetical protein